MRVKRRNGNEEEFVREKIVVAIVKSGGSVELARSVAQDVESALSGSDAVTADQIRTEVLNRLKDGDAKAYESWIAFDKEKGKA